jgi:hypothetical protein
LHDFFPCVYTHYASPSFISQLFELLVFARARISCFGWASGEETK